jgi:hypothetical protein
MNFDIIYQHFKFFIEGWGVSWMLSLAVFAFIIWLIFHFKNQFKLLPLASVMVIIALTLWYTANNTKLKQQQNLQDSITIFSAMVVPALECRSQQQIIQHSHTLNQNNTVLSPLAFDSWLLEMEDYLTTRINLRSLSSVNELSSTEAVNIFHQMIERYYPGRLPNSFYEYSSLYVEALGNRANIISQANTLCPDVELNSTQIWASIQLNALQQLPQIIKQIEAPHEFFNQLQALQNLPSSMDWQQTLPDLSNLLNHFNNWLAYMRKEWLGLKTKPSVCKRLANNLNKIARQLDQIAMPQIQDYEQTCMTQTATQMEQERLYGDTPLYEFSSSQDGNQQIVNFTAPAEALIAELTKIRALEFVNVSNSPTTEPGNDNFYWSVDLLNKAIQAFQQYQEFSQAQYSSLWLSKNPGQDALSNAKYQAQAVTLKQLQVTMTKLISDARRDKEVLFEPETLQPVDQQEANLAARVTNFNKVMDSLISLTRIFQQLGFDDTRSWFNEISQADAFGMLQQIDQLYAKSGIYQVKRDPEHSSKQIIDALFRLKSALQLQDYLTAQREKAQILALNYAQPIIVFLLNTEQDFLNVPLVNRWQNSVIEINKYLNKDPTSSLSQLETYFKNQLIVTEQNNCIEKTQGLTLPQKNDIFSLSHKNIIIQAKSLCKNYNSNNKRN